MNAINEKIDSYGDIKILLVEDNPADAELVMFELSENFSDISFQRVDNDPDLKKALIEFDPHLVISDYSMPGYSGKEALSVCLTLKPDTPLIFVSGTIGEERAVEALKKGAADYVLKSSLARLPHAVKTVLEKRNEKIEKHKKQEELKKTYQLLNTIFEATHMMIAYLDNNFNFIQVNRAFAELYKKEPSEFIGKNFFKIFSKDKYLSIFNQVLENEKPHFAYAEKIEISLLEDKPTVFLDWSVAPTNSLGLQGGIVLTAVNISDRIKYEQEATESKKRFYDALNHAPDAAVIINSMGEIVFFNKKAESYFGYSHVEIKNKPIQLLIPEKHQVQFESVIVKGERINSLSKLKNEDFDQLYAKRKNDTEFPVDITLGEINWNGAPAVITMIRDITEKKKKEVELKKLSIVASKINNAVYIGNQDFSPVWVNKAFVELTGYDITDLQNKSHEVIFSEINSKEQINQIITDLNQGLHIHTEIELTKKNGTKYWGNIHASPIKDNDGNVKQIVAIINDITSRKRAEIERDKLLKTLEERVEERTSELKTVLHQLQEKNKDIQDSIRYARNIQEAFIPQLAPDRIEVNNSFILNLPKDILSGDFYWFHHSKSKNCSYIALGDCTGHGVPGSLMTILSVQLLEQRIIGQRARKSPSKVLKEIDQAIIRFLGQNGRATINDGLEILLIRIDHDTNELIFSGAGRPLLLFQDNNLEKFKFGRFSVGGSLDGIEKEFSDDHIVNVKPGDVLYSFSDGYPDQFGGPKNKKFSTKRLENLLVEIQTKPFEEHRELLEKNLFEWQGDTNQIDDIIVLGIKI